MPLTKTTKKMQPVQTDEEAIATAKRVLSATTNWVYANNTFLTSSNWDLRLIFCDFQPSGNPEPRAAVILSHQQAKALSEALTKQLAQVEETFGPIRYVPPPPQSKPH